MNKHSNLQKTICNLCQSNSSESTEHLFTCPALISEQNSLREHVDTVFKRWSIPYSSLGHLPGSTTKQQWMTMLQSKLSTNKQRNLTLSGEKISQLTHDYWHANRLNRHRSFPHFWKCVNKALTRYNCKCQGRHRCELRNCWATPPSLITLLQKLFSLEVEGMGDVLHHSRDLKEWYSPYESDVPFGAKHDFFKQSLEGKNTYINPPFNTYEGKENLIEKVIKKIADSLQSDKPTRVILLVPVFQGQHGHLYETQAKKSRFLEIATFPQGSFSFVAPEQYYINNNFQPGVFTEKVGLYLCANKLSLQIDPVDWNLVTQELLYWSKMNTKSLPNFRQLTQEKFQERVTLSHSPRSFSQFNSAQFKPSNNFFHSYDFTLPPQHDVETAKKYITDPNHAKLLSRINQHNRLAGTLGILPNHLIQLLRLTNRESLDNITEELRFTTFWATYDLWNRRQSLYRIYRNTLPDALKVSNKEKKRTNLGKRKRRTKKSILDDCKNPFHYLLLRNPNKKPTQGT